MEDVVMPKLSDAMETGTIVRWLKRDGDRVEQGDELVEIDTDKATMPYESPCDGTLEIVAQAGAEVAIGTLIARIGEPVRGGAGPVVARDPATADAPRAAARGVATRYELTGDQRVVARRMVTSKASAPEFTVEAEVDMEACAAARAAAKAGSNGDAAPSFNDFVVRACAAALREHPNVNAAFVDDGVERYERVNVGMAVAASGRLLVPTIFDADRLDLAGIAQATRSLAARARDGDLAPAELDGGTFTVSNLGRLRVRRFTAVLNPPQAAILAVGEVTPRAAIRAGAVVPRLAMSLTLTCDHRVLYGADAAAFLSTVRERLEAP